MLSCHMAGFPSFSRLKKKKLYIYIYIYIYMYVCMYVIYYISLSIYLLMGTLIFPFSPHSHQPLLSLSFFTRVILRHVRWYLIVVLICISLIISDVEYLVMYLLIICTSSLKTCLFRPSGHFADCCGIFILLLLFCYWVVYNLILYIICIITHQICSLQIFAPIL